MRDVFRVEFEIGRLRALVVTRRAVLIEDGLSGLGVLRGGRGGRALLNSACPHAKDNRANGELQEKMRNAFHRVDSFWINAIDDGFGTGECVARKTPSAQLYDVRPTLSFTSSFAPFDTRYSMMLSEPRLAAPMRGVRPIEFVAFTSIPSSTQS